VCGRVWYGFVEVSVCCVGKSFVLVRGSECVLCVGEVCVGLRGVSVCCVWERFVWV